MANATHASAANVNSARITRLGPKRSSHTPSGSWVAANPRKYPPASKPRSAALSANSALSVGASVAVMARMSAERKYPVAKTKKTRTAWARVSISVVLLFAEGIVT